MRKPPARDRIRPGPLSALSAVACACTLALAPARAQDEDEVFEDEVTKKDGTALIGVKIEEDSWKVVKARRLEGYIAVPAHEVEDVVYAEATREFAGGVKRIRKRYYSKGIKSLMGILDKLDRFRKVGGRPWPEQYCLYYLGYAHLNVFFAWLFGFIFAGYMLKAFVPDPRTLSPALQAQHDLALAGQAAMPAVYDRAHYLWYAFALVGAVSLTLMIVFIVVTRRIDARRAREVPAP